MRTTFGRLIAALGVLALATGIAAAQGKQKVTIAVGGAGCLCYLPTVLAKQLGEYDKAGLEIELIDFKGGSQALQAVIGGSADVVSGYYDHCVNLAAKGQSLQAFVVYDRYPGMVLAVSPESGKDIKSIKDLAGKAVGVSAPGSSTDFFLKYLLAKNGLDPTSASVVGIGLDATAVAARPTPTTPTVLASTPFFASRYFRKKSVDEPGAETPTFLPARSLIDLMSLPPSGDTTSTSPGNRL